MVNFGILVSELWALGALGLLLHRVSPRFGLAPLLGYVATMIAMLNFVDWLALSVELPSGFLVRIGSYMFVPLVLAIFLTIYAADGIRPAQLVLYELAGVNAVMALLLLLLLQQNINSPEATLPHLVAKATPLVADWLRSTVTRLLALLTDTLVVAIVYQGTHNVLPGFPRWLAVGLSLLLALWVDVALFDLLASSGAPDFVMLLPGKLLATALAALAIWPLLAWYLARVAPRLPGYVGIDKRPIFDIASGMFSFAAGTVGLQLAADVAGRRQADERELALSLEQAKNQAIHDVVRDAAHDLKNPLSSIKLKIELLRRIKNSEAQARHLDDLETRVDHMVNLIDDLSALTYLNEIESLRSRPLNMSRLAHEVHQAMLPLAERKGLSLTVDFPMAIALMVQGDHDELLRALAHLLVNAIRYTDTGSVALQMDVCNGQACVITVRDTGRGINAKDLPRIFERGFRASEVIKANIEGTGMGLAIVRRVVDLHGGTIDAQSAPGRGTSVTITLPLAEVDTAVD